MTATQGTALPRARPTSRWTLERKLALFIFVLLALVIAIFGTAAFRQMLAASVERATSRLERVAEQLAVTSAATATSRVAQLREVAADPAVIAAAERGTTPADTAALRERLEGDRRAADSTLVAVELWTASGRPVLGDAARNGKDAAALLRVVPQVVATRAPARSPLYGNAGRVHVWTVVPVFAGGRVAGAVAEHRRLASNPRTDQTLRDLVGEAVSLYFASTESDEWATLRGVPVEAPFGLPPGKSATRVRDRAGRMQYVAAAPVANSPWIIVLSEPEQEVLARPREFLGFMVWMGGLLLLVALVSAWLLGRHVTRPLRTVTVAAEALAGGDYSRRVEVTGARELAQLGATFNAMAAGIGRAHAELAERNAALEQANAAKARFLAMMSHELRTPLNAIGGYTELLQLGLRGPVTPEQVEDLARIRRNRDHLLSIITDILSFARADAGHLTLHMHDVPLAAVLADTQAALGHQHEAAEVRVLFDPVPADLLVRADRDKLQQVLLNLVTNAVRFTEPGGEVRVGTEPRADRVVLRVRDTGIGIPPEKLERIFEPFVQVDASLTRKVGGTGLGLAIARELTEAMGAHLSVESTVGEGSTFVVDLQRAGVPAVPDGPKALTA
ncbi:MAG TPA: HAMP domain-containing sensor histidine kinase [Gemmatimonadaceae bacterium]